MRDWLWSICINQFKTKTIGGLHYTFCSDARLLEINKQFLSHDCYTDVITFDYSEGKEIHAEAFISVDRVRENAKSIGIKTREEMHRVIVHALLHILGFKDKTPADIKKMREKENQCLLMLKFE